MQGVEHMRKEMEVAAEKDPANFAALMAAERAESVLRSATGMTP